MKKNIKFTLIALLAVFGLAACDNNEYEYTGAPRVEGPQVYFPQENSTAVELNGLEGIFSVPISRIDTTQEATVVLNATSTSANFTLPQQVAFAKGQKDAQLEIAYTGLEYDKVDTITIQLDSAFVTPYGVSEYKFTVKCPAPWTPWCNGKAQWVAAGQDPEAWPLGETTQTCTYTYNILWSGADPGLPISYRCSTIDPTQAQFKIEHWGSDVDLIIDYNPQTNDCQVAPQFAAEDPEYGPVTVSDIPHYSSKYNYDSFPCKFIPETGMFGLNVVYYVSAGRIGNNMEFVVCDGYPDYSVALNFLGVLTDTNQKPFAQVMTTFGSDVESVKGFICNADDDASAVADAIAAGEIEGIDLAEGINNLPIEEGLTGALKVVVASLVNGEVREVSEAKFEYYGGGANPWKSLGMGLYTDDILTPSLYGEDGNGKPVYFDPIEYPVEVLENIETPGLYRLVDAYGPNVYPLYDELTESGFGLAPAGQYFVIDATHPDCVMIPLQEIGFDYGEGVTSVMSVAYNLYASGQATIEELTKAQYGGIEKNGVIVFPDFTTQDEKYNFQGYLLIGGELKDYIGYNGSIKLVLPEAVDSTKMASARKKAMARRFALNNLRKQTRAKKVSVMQMKRMLRSNITKAVMNHDVKF